MEIDLDTIEVRVLGSLMEKELATPEYYPLSLNALINACNQKTNRAPVLSLDEKAVSVALQLLKEQRIVYQSDASRVPKYWQSFTKQNNLNSRESALLCLLLLRGPQTAGELRSRAENMCSFEDLDQVFLSLENLTTTGLVAQLARQPGQKEQRFVHLLAVESGNTDHIVARPEPVLIERVSVHTRLETLEQSVAALRGEIEQLKNDFSSFKKHFE
ncbi:DUF480 domain-containing protein [uncultured Desulfobulbus sp.]|uniref:YceH family protein n=1 Tax=uncultured Desulfobulbus sp. TaxID=239745 RepID=UPI0029C61406|nr:DUF480 domain-containing protein [uncultured Desulfobulbus sp.]